MNGTRKQSDVLELKDFRIFIEEFVCLTFKRNHRTYKSYCNLLHTSFHQSGIYTVKNLVKQILHSHEYKKIKPYDFSIKKNDTLLHLATEWLHY